MISLVRGGRPHLAYDHNRSEKLIVILFFFFCFFSRLFWVCVPVRNFNTSGVRSGVLLGACYYRCNNSCVSAWCDHPCVAGAVRCIAAGCRVPFCRFTPVSSLFSSRLHIHSVYFYFLFLFFLFLFLALVSYDAFLVRVK